MLPTAYVPITQALQAIHYLISYHLKPASAYCSEHVLVVLMHEVGIKPLHPKAWFFFCCLECSLATTSFAYISLSLRLWTLRLSASWCLSCKYDCTLCRLKFRGSKHWNWSFFFFFLSWRICNDSFEVFISPQRVLTTYNYSNWRSTISWILVRLIEYINSALGKLDCVLKKTLYQHACIMPQFLFPLCKQLCMFLFRLWLCTYL